MKLVLSSSRKNLGDSTARSTTNREKEKDHETTVERVLKDLKEMKDEIINTIGK